MDILFYHPSFDCVRWGELLTAALPQARVRAWAPGDAAHADYALVWNPPPEMLQRRPLKGVFILGAGVDAILQRLATCPEMLLPEVPLYRLEDTGMARQMQEYAVSQTLHWFRRFDDYRLAQQAARWEPLPPYARDGFTVGVMGAGVLGTRVAESLAEWAFPVRTWSRSRKKRVKITSFAGADELPAFLQATRVLINLLPSTPETAGLINETLLAQLPAGAFVMNLARGAHLVEDDLLAALNRGHIKGAMLDVFAREPLPPDNPLWQHPRVAITPHVAAATLEEEAIAYIAEIIARRERGERPAGEIDRVRGY